LCAARVFELGLHLNVRRMGFVRYETAPGVAPEGHRLAVAFAGFASEAVVGWRGKIALHARRPKRGLGKGGCVSVEAIGDAARRSGGAFVVAGNRAPGGRGRGRGPAPSSTPMSLAGTLAKISPGAKP